mgnify:FL=1
MNKQSTTATVIVICLTVFLLAVLGLIGVGALLMFTLRASPEIDPVSPPMTVAKSPVMQPSSIESQPVVPEAPPTANPDVLKATATGEVAALLDFRQTDAAWSEARFTDLESDQPQATGSFTLEGESHQWECTFHFDAERNEWTVLDLIVDGKSNSQGAADSSL